MGEMSYAGDIPDFPEHGGCGRRLPFFFSNLEDTQVNSPLQQEKFGDLLLGKIGKLRLRN